MGRMNVKHWHLLPNGIEFEDEGGSFVHVLWTPEQRTAIIAHLIVTEPKR